MFEADLLRFVKGGRLAADGVPFGILHEVTGRLATGLAWSDLWEVVSQRFEAEAKAAADRDAPLSCAEWLWQAALAAHISQFHAYSDLTRRASAEERRRQLYQRAVSGLQLPARSVTISCGGVTTTAYLRLPVAGRPAPCLIMLGGLDSTKEESLRFEDLCLARGMATFVFDGPGQGETRDRLGLGEDFRPWVSQVLHLLGTISDVDRDRIGILGRSLGGHYALCAAADVPGLQCCVAWSPLGTCRYWDRYPEAIKWGFRYAANTADMGQARKVAEATLNLDDVLPRISIPTYVTHAEKDTIVCRDERDAMIGKSSPAVHHQVFAGGNHCCHNLAYLVRPMMADWAAGILRQSSPER